MTENLPRWITWLLLCLPLPYFFNNKRHSHCFFTFFSWEKRQHCFETTPLWYCLFAFFHNSTSPCAALSLLCSRSCWLFFHSLVLASSGQLGLYECHLLYARLAAASKTILAREWLCPFTMLAVERRQRDHLRAGILPLIHTARMRRGGAGLQVCLAI